MIRRERLLGTRSCQILFGIISATAITGSSCARYTPEALAPVQAPLESRLLPLDIGLGEADIVRPEGLRTVTVQTDFATVFRRDLETNVFQRVDPRWGYAEFRLTFDGDRITGGGVAVITGNVVTAFIPTLFGAPFSIRERTIQAEIVVYDSRRTQISEYVITGTAKYTVGLYTSGEYRRAGIEAAKDVMQQFRQALAPEVGSLNQRLQSVGPIG
jgi:hypothetical protein